MLAGESTPVAVLCCRILQRPHWKRVWRVVNTTHLSSGCHFVRMICKSRSPTCNPASNLWSSSCPWGQLGLLHISMVWVHALGCKCIFGASTSPYLAVWAGRRHGHMTGKALAWSLFCVLTPRTPPCTTHLVVCTRDHRSRAERWHVEISKSYYIVSMDADRSRTWMLHEGTRVQERNSNFCTQAHYFEKQC